MTVNGTVRLTRPVYAARGGGTVTPLDGWLGVVESLVSAGARELCCRSAMPTASFRKASENLARLAQVRVSHDRLREIVEGEGRAVLEATDAGRIGPDWTAADCAVRPGGPTRLMVGADGVKVPVVTAAEKAKRRANRRRRSKARRRKRRRRTAVRRHRGSDQRWKEFKIGVFYDVSGERQYAIGTAGNHDVLGRRMRREAAKLKIGEAAQRVAVSDGADWIQHQFRTRLPMIQTRILDYYHLMEHVAAAAAVCFGEGSEEAEAWRTRLSEAVTTEGAAGLLVAVHETRRSMRSAAKREALRRLEQYVAKRAEMLDYPRFLAEGFDIGSGPTEAFCKTLTARLKGSGMRWDRPNAEAMMALAALEHSHLWDTYWISQRRGAA